MGEDKRKLSELLQRCFGCDRAFREVKRPKAGDWFTKTGEQAYDKLLDTVYTLEALGAIPNADDVIEKLDSVVEGQKGRT